MSNVVYGLLRADDFMDQDMAYVAGMIIARGTLQESPQRRLVIEFPGSNLEATGISLTFDQNLYIRLGLSTIRERVSELLGAETQIVDRQGGADLVVTFVRNSIGWRNIRLLTGGQTTFRTFHVPPIFFEKDIPRDWKREFVRGYGDVAGNVRRANNYMGHWHRVRLDVLNYPTNWEVPVELCRLLQEHLDLPVQMIAWGHPNMGRAFREHQINIFAEFYRKIGFSFEHKQKILDELAEHNLKEGGHDERPCPGVKRITKIKAKHADEENTEKLDPRLVGKHFDPYWQICKALGCQRIPPPEIQESFEFVEDPEKE
jgi:hypothetical protein